VSVVQLAKRDLGPGLLAGRNLLHLNVPRRRRLLVSDELRLVRPVARHIFM
jgi:hypothetical protein